MEEKQAIIKKIRVLNELGLHTRPATMIVKLLQNYKSEVTFSYKNECVNAKSILSILMLAAHKDALITVTVVGMDAEETMERISAAFENRFEEESFHAKKFL